MSGFYADVAYLLKNLVFFPTDPAALAALEVRLDQIDRRSRTQLESSRQENRRTLRNAFSLAGWRQEVSQLVGECATTLHRTATLISPDPLVQRSASLRRAADEALMAYGSDGEVTFRTNAARYFQACSAGHSVAEMDAYIRANPSELLQGVDADIRQRLLTAAGYQRSGQVATASKASSPPRPEKPYRPSDGAALEAH